MGSSDLSGSPYLLWRPDSLTGHEFRTVWEKVLTSRLVFTSGSSSNSPALESTSLMVTNRWGGRQQACLESSCVGVFACASSGSGAGALVIDHFEKKVKPITITNLAHGSSHFSRICMALARNQAEPALGIWIKKERARSLTPTHSF